MSHFEYVYRNLAGDRIVKEVDETQARIILIPTARDNVDEAVRVMKENPGGQMQCEGGYLRYAR